jgi:cbb3-type cytochrome oxidase maturation protein
MDILYLLVPLALALALGAVLAFRWAARNDQFDDMQTPAIRMLLDDDEASDTEDGERDEDS